MWNWNKSSHFLPCNQNICLVFRLKYYFRHTDIQKSFEHFENAPKKNGVLSTTFEKNWPSDVTKYDRKVNILFACACVVLLLCVTLHRNRVKRRTQLLNARQNKNLTHSRCIRWMNKNEINIAKNVQHRKIIGLPVISSIWNVSPILNCFTVRCKHIWFIVNYAMFDYRQFINRRVYIYIRINFICRLNTIPSIFN